MPEKRGMVRLRYILTENRIDDDSILSCTILVLDPGDSVVTLIWLRAGQQVNCGSNTEEPKRIFSYPNHPNQF